MADLHPLLKPLTEQLMKEVIKYGILIEEIPVSNSGSTGRTFRCVKYATEYLKSNGNHNIHRDYTLLKLKNDHRRIVPAYSEDEICSIADAMDTDDALGIFLRLCSRSIPVCFTVADCAHRNPPAIHTEDLDLDTGDLYIRQSKRHKDRHLIMSGDMLDLCRRYDALAGRREWFFQKWDGTRYETSWYNQIWRRMVNMSGITWRGKPRPYDLRHAFASRNIIRWIDSGRDVMELLPYLSAYMGHSELTSTFYYVHLLPEKLRKSKGIDWDMLTRIYGEGVPENED